MGEANGAYLHWRDANRNYLGASNNVRIKNGVRRTLCKREGDRPSHHSRPLPIDRFRADKVLCDIGCTVDGGVLTFVLITACSGRRGKVSATSCCDLPELNDYLFGVGTGPAFKCLLVVVGLLCRFDHREQHGGTARRATPLIDGRWWRRVKPSGMRHHAVLRSTPRQRGQRSSRGLARSNHYLVFSSHKVRFTPKADFRHPDRNGR